MNIVTSRSCAAVAAVLALTFTGCGASGTRYYIGAFEQNQELRQLFSLLDRETDPKNRFVLIQQIGQDLANAGKPEKEIIFLTSFVEKDPTDLFDAYYLLMVAEAYQEMKAIPLAIHYYLRILKNHTDLLVGGQSIHLHVLQELIDLETRPEYKIEYYKELISRFGGQESVHLGSAYFFLARAEEEVGEWDQALQAYQKYLDSPDTDVPGVPDAYLKAQEKVLFYFSDKSWTVPDLNTLVDAVKDAIFTKNIAKLRKYQAKVNFFVKGWDQQAPTGDPTDDSPADGSADSNIGVYLMSSNPKIEGQLDITSNDKEAYLRTTGWNFRPPTWYLYFRKVDFPADPEANGQWEWAGIYFGEKL
jgi:tetratricopeptide (TPR) repeat protein